MLELINEKRSQYMMAESIYLEAPGQEEVAPYPSQPPSPAPPTLAKYHIYSHPNEFAHVDEIAISVSN
jgi:hypothetical protein